MEIPTAVIHRIQSSLREAAGAPAADSAAAAPPFPSVADAVAAFDSGAASAELRCGRCGAAGGLLRGAKSALCAYCGCPRRGEEVEGGGIAFRDGAAYRWLLGSLGLDGSEVVEFDSDTTGSNKSKEAPSSGMIISDLLDLKLTCLPENKETPASSITKEQPSSVDTLNLSGANLNSFFIERKEEMTAASLPQTYTVVQENKKTDSKNHESSRSEVHAASKGLMSSQKTNQIEANPAFASWDADFQSASSGGAAGDSNQPDLFKSSSAAESFSFSAPGIATNPAVGTENKTNMKGAILEHHSEDLASASGRLFDDDLSNQKIAPILESNNGTIPENSALEFTDSLDMNFAKGDQLPERDDTGDDDDEAFDDWQDFAASSDQGRLSNAGEHIVEPLKRDSSEIKTIDPLPVDSSDDWQAFASISGQGADLVRSVEGSTSALEQDLVRSAGEKIDSISLEYSSEVNPVGNVKAQNTAEMGKETDDSFDDWQDFTTCGKVQATSLNQTGDVMEVPKVSHKETDMDSLFMGASREPANTGIVNENNMLDGWQGFTGSDQAQQNSSSISGEMMSVLSDKHEGTVSVQSWVHGSNKEAAKTSSMIVESDTFDIWQDFTKSGHLQENMSNLGREVISVSPEPAKQIDSLDLWLTSNFKEPTSSKGVGSIDASSDGWQDFASFDQTQTSTKIPEERHLVKNPSGTETLDFWASSRAKEKNLEQISDNNDLFDDWNDFQNSGPQQTSLQVSSDASLFDIPSASRPDALGGLEFGNILQLASSENQKDKKEDSNEAKSALSDEQFKSTNGMKQMGDVDPLSSLWPTNSLDNNAIRKQESVNANVEQLLAQMHDLSFMLKDELSVPDKPVDHMKP
ncbi:hypothetical protein HU200_031432 [Digitaria exilis]|uniref:DUF7815 domain-containing protein n=1 Tax=Digitaria exilis TaxID=1010633 RepID=A0A835BYQ5_9POAL|nr:hypothetical protein HU200_031432 [Digitaria exilis]CAB3481108.1 unnamed protein product [Digitaria exilis]